MRILVTGGAGFIGSHLVDRLVARGHAVTVIDNLDPQVHGAGAMAPRHIETHVTARAVRFHHGDVTVRADLERALEGAEAVVHLAATVGVGQSMYVPHYYTHTNGNGTGMLLELLVAARDRVRKLVVASSMSLYGEGAYQCTGCSGTTPAERTNPRLEVGRWEVPCSGCGRDMEPQPTPETKPAEIASVYAATKKHQEDLCVSFGRAYKLPTFALRFFNVFGTRQSLNNPYTGVAAIFLSRYLNQRAPLVFEDGLQSRDFIDVRDVARAVQLATEYDGPGEHVLNIGTGCRTSVLDVAQALASHLGVAVKPELLGKFRAGDIRHCFSDPSRAEAVLGFSAEHALADGLPALVEWCRGEKADDAVERGIAELKARGLVQ